MSIGTGQFIKKYKGHDIYRTHNGWYYCLTVNGYLRADTLLGIKKSITESKSYPDTENSAKYYWVV